MLGHTHPGGDSVRVAGLHRQRSTEGHAKMKSPTPRRTASPTLPQHGCSIRQRLEDDCAVVRLDCPQPDAAHVLLVTLLGPCVLWGSGVLASVIPISRPQPPQMPPAAAPSRSRAPGGAAARRACKRAGPWRTCPPVRPAAVYAAVLLSCMLSCACSASMIRQFDSIRTGLKVRRTRCACRCSALSRKPSCETSSSRVS